MFGFCQHKVYKFNLLDIGKRAGSGIPNIFHVWDTQGWDSPTLREQFNPDRTVLSSNLSPQTRNEVAIKSGDKSKETIREQKKSNP